MRATFFKTLEDLYKEKEDIFVLTADLGYKLFDNLKIQCSDRFYDIGVAEANMIGIASGLALSGKNVYCYSIIPFLVMRAYEQIRVNLSLNAQRKEMNVNLIGVGGGLSYDISGPTHHCLEDITIMRTLPNIVFFSGFCRYNLNIKRSRNYIPSLHATCRDYHSLRTTEQLAIL